MKQITRFLAGLLAGVITGHPLKDLLAPHEKDRHHAQAIEPDHIHSELLQAEHLTKRPAAMVGAGPVPVPLVDSNDWEQAAAPAVRSHYDRLQARAYLLASSFASRLQ